MSPVEGADPDGEHEVVGGLVRAQGDILCRDAPHLQASGRYQIGGGGPSVFDRRRRPVDGEDVPGGETFGHRPGGRSRAAADLQDA
jgi:hypothetical protein